jgi:hypothetical protein
MSDSAAAATHIPLHTGGEISWDELFPPEQGTQVATTQQGTQTQQTQAQGTQTTDAAAATPVQEFLKTKTGTVYKTADDAIRGVEHKDTVIADLRQRMILATGIDPLTQQPVLQQQNVGPRSYMQDPSGKSFYNDLVAAAQKNDAQGVYNAQTKLVYDALAPLAPVLGQLARNQAVESLQGEIADIREFVSGTNYQKALDETPSLKAAIQQAELDSQHYGRLPELYKVAYRVSQGMRLPEILKAQPAAPASQTVRPTATQTTLPPSDQQGVRPDMRTSAGRKEIQRQMEARGIADQPLF